MSANFVSYFRGLSADQKRDLAQACGTTVEYLAKQVVLIHKGKATSLFKPAICSAIEVFSGELITRKDLRPNDWSDIWIELRQENVVETQKENHVQVVAS